MVGEVMMIVMGMKIQLLFAIVRFSSFNLLVNLRVLKSTVCKWFSSWTMKNDSGY